jgi:hypothetical protein
LSEDEFCEEMLLRAAKQLSGFIKSRSVDGSWRFCYGRFWRDVSG